MFREGNPPPWPDVTILLNSGNKDADPAKQVIEASDLVASIVEHAEKWKPNAYSIELLSDTLEVFGGCIMSLKHRLDSIDGVANP
jgi:hypothetical protein